MQINHTATTNAMTNYQHYASHTQIPSSSQSNTTTAALVSSQQSQISVGLQQGPFALHQLTAVQAIQHPTHQTVLPPQHPLVHLLDISGAATNASVAGTVTTNAPPKIEVKSIIRLQQPVVEDPRKKKECPTCKTKFRQLTTLRNHMKIHTDERPYQCKHCDRRFRQISTLTNHVKIHTGEKPFTCNICGRDFRQQSTLINHVKTHKESSMSNPASLLNYDPLTESARKQERKTQPHQLSAQHANNQQQQQQQRMAISKTLYTGTYTSPQADELVKPFQCNVCKKRFPQLSTLQNHERTHIDPKPYKCTTCDKSFSQSATLANHKKIHTGVKPYACNYCRMEFRQQSTLNNHMKTHAHLLQSTPGPASTSTMSTEHVSTTITMTAANSMLQQANGITSTSGGGIIQLEHHPLLHFLDGSAVANVVQCKTEHYSNTAASLSSVVAATNATNFKTEPTFQTNGECNAPIRTTNVFIIKGENPDRPFGCSVCQRYFAQQSTVINHIKTHTGEKPYNCKVCDANFRQVATLNNHMKIHTGDKPYECSYCAKKFRQKSTLQNHLRVHACLAESMGSS